jgi:subtilase family serine protease
MKTVTISLRKLMIPVFLFGSAYLIPSVSVSTPGFNAIAFPAVAKVHTDLEFQPLHEIAAFNAESPPSTSFSPAQIRRAYGFDRLPNQGEGQTVAVVIPYNYPRIQSDLKVFAKTFGLPPCNSTNACLKRVYVAAAPKASKGWATEAALDVEWVHAIAPNAKKLLVIAASNSGSDLFSAVNLAVRKGATVVTMSWGGQEFRRETIYSDRFFRPRNKNVSFVAAAGNSGGNRVFYPAASPYVRSVGGSSLTAGMDGEYLGEIAWSHGSGGLSQFERTPDFQKNLPMPFNPIPNRSVPDVAYNADPEFGFAVFSSFSPYGAGWLQVGGTSAAAPQWAGLIAIANSIRMTAQKRPFGEFESITIHTALYQLAGAEYLHDISLGSSGACGSLCQAASGYDFVTGLGSPIADTLAPALAAQ